MTAKFTVLQKHSYLINNNTKLHLHSIIIYPISSCISNQLAYIIVFRVHEKFYSVWCWFSMSVIDFIDFFEEWLPL